METSAAEPAVDEPTDPSEGEANGADEGGDGPRRGLSTAKVVILVLACAFLAGAAGYLIGDRTSGPPDSAVDTGFLHDMLDHHEQAVTMASVTTASASDPVVRDFAREVLIEQRYEIGLMDAYLQARDEERGDPDRDAMAWMGMGMPLAQMPGYASEEELAALQAADPEDQNELFLELMIAHHRGGVAMAEYAARHAEDPRVRRLAEVMADVQAKEIIEYELKLSELQAG